MIQLWWSSCDQNIKSHFVMIKLWSKYKSSFCDDQVVNLGLSCQRIYVEDNIQCLMDSMKISNQEVCSMMVLILKIYLKPHQKKIKDSSEVVKSKIMWQGIRSFRIVKEMKCKSSSYLCQVISVVCKGIGLTLNFTKENHTCTFNLLESMSLFIKMPKKFFVSR